jgi:hypothetical protein
VEVEAKHRHHVVVGGDVDRDLGRDAREEVREGVGAAVADQDGAQGVAVVVQVRLQDDAALDEEGAAALREVAVAEVAVVVKARVEGVVDADQGDLSCWKRWPRPTVMSGAQA